MPSSGPAGLAGQLGLARLTCENCLVMLSSSEIHFFCRGEGVGVGVEGG